MNWLNFGQAMTQEAMTMDDMEESIEPKPKNKSEETISSTILPGGADLNIQDWGLVDYSDGLQRQLDLVDLVAQELARETLVFCSHSPVVTLGRATREGDVFAWKGETVEVNRGGRATYHGPSQIVVYPILDLNHRGRDLHKYMRLLEEAVVRTLADFGIASSGRSPQIQEGDAEAVEATGVWVGSRKIASIGIGARKWITFHGLALNVDADEQAFSGMKPCGFLRETMVSMEELLGGRVDREQVKTSLKRHLIERFS